MGEYLIYVGGAIVAAGLLVLAAFVLSMMQRRREVRRMHEMRRDADAFHMEPTKLW